MTRDGDQTMRRPRIKTRKGAVLGYGAIGWLLLAIGMMAGAGWFTVSFTRAREAARSAQCVSNFKQLGLALHNYESDYGCLPPAYVADAHGKRLYSWRVLLMAYADRTNGWIGDQFWQKFRYDEPWDSPYNRRFHSIRPGCFFCPSDPKAAEKGYTSVLAVVGPDTLFPGVKPRRLAEIRDDPESILMLVESGNAEIHWMEPRDLDWNDMGLRVNDRSQPSIWSNHHEGYYGGPHVTTAAGGVSWLPDAIRPADIKAMLLINDGGGMKIPLGLRARW